MGPPLSFAFPGKFDFDRHQTVENQARSKNERRRNNELDDDVSAEERVQGGG